MPKSDVTRIQAVSNLLMESFGEREVFDPFGGRGDHLYIPDLLAAQRTNGEKGILFRPPITFRQAELYIKSHGKTWDGRSSWWEVLKDEVARITMMGGIVVSVGWDSNGIGIGRGFQMERILMVAHGGHWRDTIVTVERKVYEKDGETEWILGNSFLAHSLDDSPNIVVVPDEREWHATPEDPIF